MRLKDDLQGKEYYKITLVSLAPDKCNILKGPEEEKRLAEILRDDYSISRYEKMLQLVIKEKVAANDQEFCFRLLSLESLQRAFRKGQDKVTGSYIRNVQGEMREVSVSIYPRRFGKQGELEEFMLYISKQE